MKKIYFLLAALLLAGNLLANDKSVRLSAEYFLTRFYQGQYVETYEVTPASYVSSGDKERKPVTNIFDNDWLNVWQSASADGEQSLTFTFSTSESISKLVYGLQGRNPVPTGHGYAQTIKVYSSPSTDGDNFQYRFSLESGWKDGQHLFLFPEPVEGVRLKLVFEDVYSVTNAKACVEVAELKLLRNDPVFDHVLRMFADEQQMTLREEYKDDALLDRLENEAGNHLARSYMTERIQHAKAILEGRIDENIFPYEVRVAQKTGPDNERYVMVFFAEKYTVFEKESYFSTVRSNLNSMFTYEPFKSMRDKFNVYVVFTPSNESKYNYGYDVIDSYFSTYLTGSADGGSARVAMFLDAGRAAANSIFAEFTEKYLDEGATLHCANVLMNTASYGGAGHVFENGVRGIIYTSGAGQQVLVHELGHAVGMLGDEYYYMPSECANITAVSDASKAKWSEFIGFRNIRHVSLGGGYYRPSAICMMELLHYDFCEVCKLGLFEIVNSVASNKDEWYIADPLVYSRYEEYYPTVIENSNIINANGEKLQFRTVVKNLSSAEKTVVVDFKITDASGTVERFVCQSQEYVVPAQGLKSLTSATEAAVSGLQSGDIIVAKVTDKATGEVVLDYGTYKKNYGTLLTSYMLDSKDGATEIMAPSSLLLPGGSKVEVGELPLEGYIYRRSNRSGLVTINEGQTSEVVHYYVKAKGAVTLRLVDESGSELQTIERYVAYNESFVPSQNDFPAREGYRLVLPANVPVYDGVSDIELTYRLVEAAAAEHTLSVTECGYTTLYLDFDAAIPVGVDAYIATGVDGGYVKLKQVEGVLPAMTGVVVNAPAGDYLFGSSSEAVADVKGNILLGTVKDEYIAGKAYVLSSIEGGVPGFYLAEPNRNAAGEAGDTHFLNRANRAYLPQDAIAAAAQGTKFYAFDFDETTGIGEVKRENVKATGVYDLTGRQLDAVTEPGIYIIDGKKVLVK